MVPDDLPGAEIDDALGAEHVRGENVLNGPLVVQLDQSIHGMLLPYLSELLGIFPLTEQLDHGVGEGGGVFLHGELLPGEPHALVQLGVV